MNSITHLASRLRLLSTSVPCPISKERSFIRHCLFKTSKTANCPYHTAVDEYPCKALVGKLTRVEHQDARFCHFQTIIDKNAGFCMWSCELAPDCCTGCVHIRTRQDGVHSSRSLLLWWHGGGVSAAKFCYVR